MPHHTALIATIAAGLGLAFVFGLIATRLKLPPLVGYLIAGIAVGPHSPWFVADVDLAAQLAEIGVILLMFGVGMHFSIRDLLAVRRIALPGAVAQIAVATLLGAVVARLWGWTWGEGFVFGLALSVASTVVLLRALEARGVLDTVDGRIAVGWLIVEDLVMVLALVVLPALAVPLGGTALSAAGHAAGDSLAGVLALTFVKVTAFVGLMLVVGSRVVPWLLERVARTGSRELFTLSVLAVALGIAFGAAALFGVSFALGAFFAGVVISESELSHQAAADALPFQDAFAVLFFVSVGMLFDPAVLVEQPLAIVATVLIIVLGKSLAAFGIVLFFHYPVHTALTVSASLAQIGEFSFILAGLGLTLGLFPPEGQSLVLAGAIISITLNPLAFAAVEPAYRWIRARPRLLDALERPPRHLVSLPSAVDRNALVDHVVIVGFGRVGSTIARALEREQRPYIAVEQNREHVETLRERGIPVLYGDAARAGILELAHVERARMLVIATPDPYQARRIVELARRANPDIDVVARTHSETELRYLERHGVAMAVMGERELALGMARYALCSLGVDVRDADVVVSELRGREPGDREAPSPSPRGPAAAEERVTIRRIFVPLDGSARAERALAIASIVARRTAARVELVHVREEGAAESAYPQRLVGAGQVAGHAFDPSSLEVSVLDGPVEETLLERIATTEADLVVMTRHGRGLLSRTLLGSVADAIVRRSHVPVLLVPGEELATMGPDSRSAFASVLLPLDGSEAAEEIIPHAFAVAGTDGVRYELLRVHPPPITDSALASGPPLGVSIAREGDAYLSSLAARIGARGALVSAQARAHTSAAAAILREASQGDVQLIAMASRGLGATERLLFGSVADEVVRNAPCPVLVWRPAPMASEAEDVREPSSAAAFT